MQDYTPQDEIIRGSRWPPADVDLVICITHPDAWPAGADGWTWSVLLSRWLRGQPPDLEITPSDVTILGDTIYLTIQATGVQTASLAGRKSLYKVDVSSVGPLPGEVPSFYDCVQGTARVRWPAGQG